MSCHYFNHPNLRWKCKRNLDDMRNSRAGICSQNTNATWFMLKIHQFSWILTSPPTHESIGKTWQSFTTGWNPEIINLTLPQNSGIPNCTTKNPEVLVIDNSPSPLPFSSMFRPGLESNNLTEMTKILCEKTTPTNPMKGKNTLKLLTNKNPTEIGPGVCLPAIPSNLKRCGRQFFFRCFSVFSFFLAQDLQIHFQQNLWWSVFGNTYLAKFATTQTHPKQKTSLIVW